MSTLAAEFTLGTHRLVPPEETLRRITPVLLNCGITRCADVTQLDNLGVPTYCAIRPTGRVLQVSNGKGLLHSNAKVSALMEAIEFFHAEHPGPEALHQKSISQLEREGTSFLDPAEIGGTNGGYFSDDFIFDWIEGQDLFTNEPVWGPSGAAYFREHSPLAVATNTNGLASGNHLIEATLHALYELIERDAGSNLSVDGKVLICERSRVVNNQSIDDNVVRPTIEKIEAADTKVVLLSMKSCVPVHTFAAFLLNKKPFANVSTLNFGWGTHWDCQVAACRALTEACQSRLTFIHGSREDILEQAVYDAECVSMSRAFKFFEALTPNANWADLHVERKSLGTDLFAIYEYLLEELAVAGHRRLIRFDLTKPQIGEAVVKVVAPSLRFNTKLF